MSITPLNGKKTHPLSEHALAKLREIHKGPVPCCSVNPGVVNRLLRGALVEEVLLISKLPSHRGRAVTHLQITDAGRAAIGKPPATVPSTAPPYCTFCGGYFGKHTVLCPMSARRSP